MFAFTKQEQRFLLLMIVSFFIGLTIKYYRQSVAEKSVSLSWKAEREQIYAEFLAGDEQEPYVVEASQERKNSISKQAITSTININSASFEELQILPRIGPATARKIIDYRNEYGSFEHIRDIQNVKSIGPKTFANIEKYITVD